MVLPSSILLPLYIYPSVTTDPKPWDLLRSTLSSNPTIHFDIVINPASGPNTVLPTSTNILSDYLTELTTLRQYPNIKLYGYVHTSYGTQSLAPQADLLANITRYSQWPSSIKMDGIFFDEIATGFDSTYFSNLQSAVNLAHSSSLSKIIFNPGQIPDSRYYSLADYVIAYEGPLSSATNAYDRSKIAALTAGQRANSSIVIHTYTGTASDQKALVQDLVGMGVGSLDVTTLVGTSASDNPYGGYSALWTSFVSDFGAAVSGKTRRGFKA